MAKYEYSINRYGGKNALRRDAFVNFFKRNTLKVDISKFLNLKRAALNEHRSQVNIISSKQKEAAVNSYMQELHLTKNELFYKV